MPKDWLETPVRTTFAMHREGKKLQAAHYSEIADLNLISQMKLSYYKSLKDRYDLTLDPEKSKLPPPPSGPVLQSGSKEGIDFMRSIAQGMKRDLGYGRG